MIHPLIDICLLEKTGKDKDVAIEQEKNLNQNIYDCKGKITCNIGKIIDEIRRAQTI